MRNLLIICSVFLIMSAGMASGLSLTPPDISPYENPPVIDSVNITGVKSLAASRLQDVLSQKSGEKISLKGVQHDLKAIAALYNETASADVEAWSGLELITSRITVTSDIDHSPSGHVTINYRVKEWFPSKR